MWLQGLQQCSVSRVFFSFHTEAVFVLVGRLVSLGYRVPIVLSGEEYDTIRVPHQLF